MRRNRDSPSPTLNCLFVFESEFLAADAYIRLRRLQVGLPEWRLGDSDVARITVVVRLGFLKIFEIR